MLWGNFKPHIMKTKHTRMPSVVSVRKALAEHFAWIRRNFNRAELLSEDGDSAGTDIRLQVYADGRWLLHSGDSSYDQDHRGFWGSSFLSYDRQNLTDLARDLIDQAAEQAAESESLGELSNIIDNG